METTPKPVAMLSVSPWERYSLPQGVQWDGGQYFVSQAWTTGVGPAEDTIIHRYSVDGAYLDCMRLPNAGHCSSFGLRRIDRNRTNIYVRWNTVNAKGVTTAMPVARVLYRPGIVNLGDKDTGVYPIEGQPCVDPIAMRLATRKVSRLGVETWSVYDLAALNAGQGLTPLGSFKIPAPVRNFQGHTISGHHIFRQYGNTGGKSVIWQYDWTTGKKVRTIDTSAAVPNGEPEGVYMRDGRLYFCKRLGGANVNRRLYLFRADGFYK